MPKGLVIQTTGSNHSVKSNDKLIECTLRGVMRKRNFKSTNPVAVGDNVVFDYNDKDKNTGIITDILPRKNCIVRKSSNLSKSTHIIAANLDSVNIVFTLKNPLTSTVFLDRLLVAAESYNIKANIIFNKIDIYSDAEIENLMFVKDIYDSIGYNTITCSVTEGTNLDKVKNLLRGNISAVIGHSGVGKSSLINKIEPDLNLKTGKISDYHKSGTHVTTYARLLELSIGGYIIDTPGIRGFGLVDIKKEEVYHFFPEFFKVSKGCRYYNCTHIHEPGCAVIEALENDDISIFRYKSYLNMVLDENDKHRKKDCGIF